MIDWIGASCTWLIGAVLVSSGLLKLGTAPTFQVTLSQFGLPQWTWQDIRFARAFPWCELLLGLAVVLVPAPVQLVPAIGILALFVAFLVLVARVWRRPTPVSCNCFGGLGDDVVGVRTVIRNGVLVALALAAVALHRAPSSVVADRIAGWCSPLPAVLAVAVAAILVVWRAVAARRHRARLIRTLTVQDVHGNALPIAEFQDPPTFLVFFAPGCGACHALVDDFRWWPHLLKDGYDLQPVFLGTPEQFADQEKFAPLAPYAWYATVDVARAFGINGTPGATTIDPANPLGHDPVAGYGAIRNLVLRLDWQEAAAAIADRGGDESADRSRRGERSLVPAGRRRRRSPVHRPRVADHGGIHQPAGADGQGAGPEPGHQHRHHPQPFAVQRRKYENAGVDVGSRKRLQQALIDDGYVVDVDRWSALARW